MQWQLAAQALALLCNVAWVAVRTALDLIASLARLAARGLRLWPEQAGGGATFYVGSVMHVRRAPKGNRFTCVCAGAGGRRPGGPCLAPGQPLHRVEQGSPVVRRERL